jgi:hypothetical protein
MLLMARESVSRSVELMAPVDVRRVDLNQFVADPVSVFLSFRWNWGPERLWQLVVLRAYPLSAYPEWPSLWRVRYQLSAPE